MGVGGQRHAPNVLPSGKTRYPLYRRLGVSQGRSGWVRKISPTSRFDPRTFQPVASRFTDWAIPAMSRNIFFLVSATTHVQSWLSQQFSSIRGGHGLVLTIF
jgi:hypothetical protein